MLRNQKGFTLVELAIALVVIGLILGAVLKGQDLINNAKAKKVLGDVQGMSALAHTFFDRYGRLPGDCDRNGAVNYNTLNATFASFGAAAAPGFCNNAAANADDQWNDLIQAQLMPNTAPNDLSKNAYNGTKYMARYTLAGVDYNVVVAADIPCYAAKMLDTNIDSALDAGTGYVREVTGAAALRNATNAWTACNGGEQTLVDVAYFFDRRPN